MSSLFSKFILLEKAYLYIYLLFTLYIIFNYVIFFFVILC